MTSRWSGSIACAAVIRYDCCHRLVQLVGKYKIKDDHAILVQVPLTCCGNGRWKLCFGVATFLTSNRHWASYVQLSTVRIRPFWIATINTLTYLPSSASFLSNQPYSTRSFGTDSTQPSRSLHSHSFESSSSVCPFLGRA